MISDPGLSNQISAGLVFRTIADEHQVVGDPSGQQQFSYLDGEEGIFGLRQSGNKDNSATGATGAGLWWPWCTSAIRARHRLHWIPLGIRRERDSWAQPLAMPVSRSAWETKIT